MRIAEYKQTGTETVEMFELVLDEDGNETGEVRTITREVPIMSMVYRDMTPDEEAEALAQQAEWDGYEQTRPLTPDERMDAIEDALVELAEILVGE